MRMMRMVGVVVTVLFKKMVVVMMMIELVTLMLMLMGTKGVYCDCSSYHCLKEGEDGTHVNHLGGGGVMFLGVT